MSLLYRAHTLPLLVAMLAIGCVLGNVTLESENKGWAHTSSWPFEKMLIPRGGEGTGREVVSHFSPLVFGRAQPRPNSPRMPNGYGDLHRVN